MLQTFNQSLVSWLLALLLAGLSAPARAETSDKTPWKAGLAKTVITPEKSVWLAGYGSKRAPEGKLHDLWMKALALEDTDGRQVVLITSDFQGVPKSMSDRVFEQLEKVHGLQRHQVMFTFSHNHCGPRLGDDLVDYYPVEEEQVELVAEYTQQMISAAVAMVGEALADLAPARLAMGEGKTTFAVNRRNNPEAEVPRMLAEGIPLEGPVDHAVPVLTVTRPDGELAAILFGYACHPTTLSFTQWCGDYPGFAQLALEQNHPGAMAMFVNTCGGDQNPLPRRTVELCARYGQMLAEAVEQVLKQPLKPIASGVRSEFELIDLAYLEVASREQLHQLLQDSNAIRARWAARMLQKLDEGETFSPTYPYPLHAWQLGQELLIVGMGAETVVDYSLRFKREFGPGTWVFGYADDMIAYIPSRRVWDEGGYEGGSSLYEYGRPAFRWAGDVEERIAAAVNRLVKRVRPVNLYVAPEGDDAWSGRLPSPNETRTDGPFATLQKAQQTVRKLRSDGANNETSGAALGDSKAIDESAGAPETNHPITVHLRGGTYELSEPLKLTREDSGTERAPIVWRNYEDEEVVLSGGHRVRDFQAVTDDAIRQRLPAIARDKVLQADLSETGISDLGEVAETGKRLELFFHDQPMTLARWPNEDFVRVGEVVGGEPITSHGIRGDAKGKFVFADGRIARWAGESDAWLSGYWFWDWSDGRQRVRQIDVEKQVIELEPPHHHYGYRPGQRFYAFNLLSELDEPGEWYLDRQNGRLYFWPPEEMDEGVTLSIQESLLELQETSWVTIRGLTLEAARATAVAIQDGTGIQVGGCRIRNVGGWGVTISGGTEHRVTGCDIFQTGEGGISLTGGDRQTLTPGGHVASNNHIHHYARLVRTYRPAIGLQGVGNRAANNWIHDAPHTAILLGGNDHLIEWNDIHHVCQETGDVGAFYMGRDWSMRGNRVRHNFFHEIHGPGLHGAMAVYLDDAASGTTVFGNLFVRAGRAAFIGGGRDNVIDNNIFVECEPAIHVDARGLGWMHETVAPDGVMHERLAAVPYREAPWSDRYPELLALLDDEPAAPRGNVVRRNIRVGGTWRNVETKAEPGVAFEANLVDQDPKFVDPDQGDFRLREDSPAWEIGFEPIPLERIGLVRDEWRTAAWLTQPRQSARAASDEDGDLRVSVFQVDATPPLGSPVAYAPARTIEDPLSARGLVLLGAGRPIVLCAVDWIGIGNEGHDAWRERLAEAAGTTPDRVAVHTLHQHDGPRCDFTAEQLLAAHGLGGTRFDLIFARQTIERTAEALRGSLANARRVTHLGVGQAEVEKVASNRRILGEDGRVTLGRMSATRNAEAIAAPEGVIDPVLRAISFWDEAEPVVCLTYYATHPQSYYGQGDVTAEFVGLARAEREKALGGLPHLHFNGASGNVAAGKYNDGSPENRPVLRDRMADGMRRAWEATERRPLRASDVTWRVEPVHLPPAEHLEVELLQATLSDGDADARLRLSAATKLAFLARAQRKQPTELSCLRLGNVSILHMPGELFVEYQLAAQAMRPDEMVCMAAYGDYGPGYIGTEIAYSQGGYETQPSSSNVAPHVEQVLLEAIRRLLTEP